LRWRQPTSPLASTNIARFLERFGILLVVIAMMLLLYALEPQYFLTARNLTNILQQIAMNALLSIGMFLVIVTAGIDLSVGSVLALAMMALTMADVAGWPWPIVILLGPAIGLLVGIIKRAGLTLLRLPHPFIMTLGTLNAARGLTNLISDGRPISRPFRADKIPRCGANPASVPGAARRHSGQRHRAPCRLRRHGLLLAQDGVGRHVVAVGGNPQAARVSGISVDRILVLVYALSGFFAGLAALLLAGRTIPASRTPASAPNSTPSPPSSSAVRASSAGAAPCSASSPVCSSWAAPERPEPHERQRLLAAASDRADHHPCRLHRRAEASRRSAQIDLRKASGGYLRCRSRREKEMGNPKEEVNETSVQCRRGPHDVDRLGQCRNGRHRH